MPTSTNSWRGIVKADPSVLMNLRAHKVKPGGKIAPGFKAKKALNLKYMGGKTISNLSFKSFYLGGSAWMASDMQNIDAALSGALADPHLNNVMLQYYPGATSISTAFLGSKTLTAAVDNPFTRDSVNPVLAALLADGSLQGADLADTVVCLMLPPGIELTTDAAGGVGRVMGDDNLDSSKQGLGGYHGSCHIGNQVVYFSVAVYSQFINGQPNGIPVWPDSWKNVVATLYHELNEARTDPDVEESMRQNNNALLGWYSQKAGEIGDIPITEAGANIRSVMVELTLGNGVVAPIQLMWSNAVGGPEGPFG